MNADRYGNTRGREDAKGSRKEAKMQEFMYGDTTNVEQETCGYTGSNWGPLEQQQTI